MSILKLRKRMRGWGAKFIWGVLVFIFVVGAFAGFGRLSSGSGRRSSASGGAPNVVARVNGEKIFRDQFNQVVAWQLRNASMMGGGESVTSFISTKEQALEQLIDSSVKLQASKRERIRVRGRDIDDEVEKMATEALRNAQMQASSPKFFEREIRKKFGTLDAFKDTLRSRYSREGVKEQVRLQKLEEKIKDRIHVDEKDYQESTARIKARLIMVKPASEMRPPPGDKGKAKSQGPSKSEREAAARRKSEDLLTQIKTGADFAKLAKENSSDPTTASKGGDLGEIGMGDKSFYYGQEFDKVAFRLKPGEVSNVFKGQDGYYIVKVEARRYNIPPDYEQVTYKCLNTKCQNEWTAPRGAKACPKCTQDKVRQVSEKKKEYVKQLESQRQNQEWGSYTEKLRDDARVDILDPELRAAKKQSQNKWKSAVPLYLEALKYADGADPYIKSPAIRYNLAVLYRMENKLDEALEQIKQALTVDDSPELRVEMTKLLRDKGQKKEAVEELKKAAEMAVDDSPIHRELSMLFRDLGQKDLAAREEKKASTQGPGGFGGINMMRH